MTIEQSASRADLVNAFLPSSGVEDPHRFAGRRSQVEELTNALITTGSVPLIYGHRGLGKSSLALQASRIAQGDVELLSQLGFERLVLADECRFIALYVTCSDSTDNLSGILQIMINAVESLQYDLDGDSETYRLMDKTTRARLSLKLFSAETTRKYEAERNDLDTAKFSNEENLIRLTDALSNAYQQNVLFVLDEVDRVRDTAGLASFLKSHSSERLKFVLVGIGTTEGDLLRDHASLNRQLVPVHVAPMTGSELRSIVERTEEFLRQRDLDFTFTAEAKRELIRVAAGFPWFVHLIGQAALLSADKGGKSVIGESLIKDIVIELPKGRLAKQYNDRYLAAVGDSYPREAVLRLFSEWRDENVPTSEIYSRAGAFTTSPAQYVGQLGREKYGAILVPSPGMSRMYRFVDEMFKTYVRMRESVYLDLASKVREKFST